MSAGINYTALGVLVALFVLVTVMGFWASNWRRGEHLESLDEWGLGGRTFGVWITWFLIGGDIYTAYTFVAVPAAMFATGAVAVQAEHRKTHANWYQMKKGKPATTGSTLA